MLLNENKNALKFLHHAHGFNFEKDFFIGSIPGRFTFKMANDYINANLNGAFVAAVLVKTNEKSCFNNLHYATMKNGRFEIDRGNAIKFFYKHCVDYFFSIKDFEETRKNKTERVYIIAQKKEFLLTPKNETKIESNTRYKTSDVRKCGDGRGNSWINEIKLTPATGTKENAVFKPYNTFYGNEKRSANTNDIIDKSGFILHFQRLELKRRALELRKLRDAETLKNTDFSKQIKNIEKRINAVKAFFIKSIEGAQTERDAHEIDLISNKFRYLFIYLKQLDENYFMNVESKTKHIEKIEKQIDEILKGE